MPRSDIKWLLRRRVHLDQVFPDILFKQDGQLDLIDPK